jgi:hypothetical protein
MAGILSPLVSVSIDVLAHVVEFLPQVSMGKLATTSRRLAMLICSCDEKVSFKLF